jgi:hypothetical protein
MADQKPSFKPVSGNVLPRFAGIATFMRLPHLSVPEAAPATAPGRSAICPP